MSDGDNDAAEALIGAGILLLVGYGIFKLLKSVGSYSEGQLIGEAQVQEVVASYTPSQSSSNSRQRIYAFCDKCGEETEQCQEQFHYGSNRCMVCNGGVDDDYYRECYECGFSRRNDD